MAEIQTPETVRKWVQKYRKELPDNIDLSEGAKGALIGTFNKAVKGEGDKSQVNERRHLVWGWVLTPDDESFRPMSRADLLPGDWSALSRWVGSNKQGDIWVNRPSFEAEARWILTKAIELIDNKQAMKDVIKSTTKSSINIELDSPVYTAIGLGGDITDQMTLASYCEDMRSKMGDKIVKDWLLRF